MPAGVLQAVTAESRRKHSPSNLSKKLMTDDIAEGRTHDSVSDWSRKIDWVERHAQENLKSRFATAELIARDAHTTLTALLAAVGGSAFYGVKIFVVGPTSRIAVAGAIVCCYFLLLCLVLVCKCMMFRSYPALYQEPRNILRRDLTLEEVREAELENLDERIQEARTLNDRRAEWLNGIRIATALGPIVFAAAAWLVPMCVCSERPLSVEPESRSTHGAVP